MKRSCILLFTLLLALSAAAQTPKLEPGAGAPVIPTVTFVRDWPAAHPQHLSITVDSAGRAAYTAVDDTTQEGEPYLSKFTVSRRLRERIFADAKSLNYFQGQFDFTGHKIASTGAKTLSYADPERHFQTTYNWSENSELMALTGLFLGISNTLEGGRRLEYLHRFDRLGLNGELKDLEALAKEHSLPEVHLIEPVLRQIADDPAVMELARGRARHLLGLAAAENEASSPSP